jgi:hypothetical protein
MIYCKELKKEFANKADLFKELVKNEVEITDLKKGALKSTDNVSVFGIKDTQTIKALSFVKDGYVYPVINTTNYFDSHGDVHFPNLWNKTLKDKAKRIFYVLEHELELDSVIAFPNDVNAFVKIVSWSDLGKDYNGTTQALIFEIPKSKIKIDKVAELFNEQVNFENSVRMRYINVNLAINSTDSDYEKQKALWDARIDLVANKEEAISNGYMWCVDEASIEKEGSLVLFGSNDATPVIYQKNNSLTKCDSCDEETEDYEAENGEIVCKKCGNKKPKPKKSTLDNIEAEKSLQAEQDAQKELLKQLLKKF